MLKRLAAGIADGEHQPVVGQRELERVGAGIVRLEREAVLLEQVENGDLPLMLDLGIVAADRSLVEGDLDQLGLIRPSPRLLVLLRLGHG